MQSAFEAQLFPVRTGETYVAHVQGGFARKPAHEDAVVVGSEDVSLFIPATHVAAVMRDLGWTVKAPRVKR